MMNCFLMIILAL